MNIKYDITSQISTYKYRQGNKRAPTQLINITYILFENVSIYIQYHIGFHGAHFTLCCEKIKKKSFFFPKAHSQKISTQSVECEKVCFNRGKFIGF